MKQSEIEQIKVYSQIFAHNNIYLTEEELLLVGKRLKDYDKKKGFLQCLDEIIEEYKLSGKFSEQKTNTYYMKTVRRNRKMINQLSMNGKVLKTFNSLTAAAEFLGDINFKSNISSVCSGRMRSFKGYRWMYI